MLKHLLLLFCFVLCATPLFAQVEYRSDWNRPPATFKPYIVKFATPSGVNILRDVPPDHLHHHALMFAIKVDGVNFWEEYNPKDFGRQETFTLAKASASADGVSEQKIKSVLNWTNGIGQILVMEKRAITCKKSDVATILDWCSELTLPSNREKAELGGNEYHGLGMRFVESMDKDGKFIRPADAGKSEGRLTPCRWMGYTAKVDGKPVTVAIFDTKENSRPMLAFTMGGDGKGFAYLAATANLHREPLILTPEKPITFHYKVVLWDGEKTAEEIEKIEN